MLQLAGDVLRPPLSEVRYDHPGVEGARLGPHPQLLDGFLLEVQEADVVILMDTRSSVRGGLKSSRVVYQPSGVSSPTWFPAPCTMPLMEAESQSSEKAAACPCFKLVS